MKPKHYLVTGGSGFIGSALVKRLVSEGHRVRVLDNNLRGHARHLEAVIDKIEFVTGDIRDAVTVEDVCKDIDSVLHLAYVNGTEYFYKMPDLVLDVGVKGMVNVLDACKKHDISELVLASSSEVYQTPPTVPTDESVPLIVPDVSNPRYSYGGGKIICELMAINHGRKDFERVLIFRPHNVYGPDMGWEHVIPQFVLRMEQACAASDQNPLEFPIQGTGEETRSFVYIDDFIDGLMVMLAKGEHLNIYHIGTMEEISIKFLAEQIGAFFKRDILIQTGELQKGGTPRRCPDITKLKALGYDPQTSLSEGVAKTAEWYVNNRDKVKKLT